MVYAMDAVHTSLLPATPPFTLGASLRALSGFPPCAGDQTVTGDRVRKAFPLPDTDDARRVSDLARVPAQDKRHPAGPAQAPAHEAVVVEVAPRPDDEPGVALTVFAARELSSEETASVERQVTRWLSLDDELAPFLAITRRDPAMRPVLAATRGLHQVRFPSLAEGTVHFTLTQRSTQWYAAARKRRIAAELGPRLTVDGVTHVAFPNFSTLSTVDFTGFAGNAARGQRLAAGGGRGLAEVVAGIAALDEEWLRTAPYAEARDALLHVRGVGTFTAHALLLRVLGRPDDVPLEMAQFTGIAKAVYGADPPSPQELREWYGPYVGWWAYLCRTGLGWLDRTATGSGDRSGSAAPSSRARPGPVVAPAA